MEICFEFPEINYEKIKQILVKEHEFSEERVNKQIDKLKELEKAKKQKNLERVLDVVIIMWLQIERFKKLGFL